MSGGQRQRVALGRAMVRKPDVFLFDEPLSNLDAKLRVSTRISIAQLHQDLKAEGQNATMIYVTHDQVEAMTLGDRICVLDQGQIMQVDTPMNLYHYPANKFVAGFIGSPAMNLIHATLSQENNLTYVQLDNGSQFVLPVDKAEKVAHKIGQKVWLGLRPEHISVITPSKENISEPQQNVELTYIKVVESMGNEVYLYCVLGQEQIISRCHFDPKNNIQHSESHYMHFDMTHCHLFDVDSELALLN